MMVDLAGQSCFFVRATMDLAFGRAVNLAISGVVSTEIDIAIGFSGLFLW